MFFSLEFVGRLKNCASHNFINFPKKKMLFLPSFVLYVKSRTTTTKIINHTITHLWNTKFESAYKYLTKKKLITLIFEKPHFKYKHNTKVRFKDSCGPFLLSIALVKIKMFHQQPQINWMQTSFFWKKEAVDFHLNHTGNDSFWVFQFQSEFLLNLGFTLLNWIEKWNKPHETETNVRTRDDHVKQANHLSHLVSLV